jgi:hypothetical protein
MTTIREKRKGDRQDSTRLPSQPSAFSFFETDRRLSIGGTGRWLRF